MSKKYEFSTTDCELELVGPGNELLEDEEPGHYVLVIGNPWASAYAVVGTLDEIAAFARRIDDLVSPDTSVTGSA